MLWIPEKQGNIIESNCVHDSVCKLLEFSSEEAKTSPFIIKYITEDRLGLGRGPDPLKVLLTKAAR